ncbi:MAG: molybdopterin-dependent oxidoreductase, partial [Deltaproteobacteria bacterium]|nr:molybdopterin-dependent oxidoreductase [Deltaproteobacteria bacterium]
ATQESVCLFSTHRAFLDTFGEVVMPDVRNARYVLMPGSNRFEALVTPDSSDLMEMLQEGGKLCVVDPRCTKTAALATDWLQIRAGTDLALALALIHVIITEKLYNAAWVEEHTFGLDKLAAHVAGCTPDWAAGETGLPAERIVRVAREMAQAAPRALVYPGRRTSDYVDSTQIRRGWAILNALLGNFDCRGGLMVPSPFRLRGIPQKMPWYDDNPSERLDESRIPLPFKEEASFVPLREGVISGKPYPAAGWLVFKTNPMQTAPDQAKTLAMIDRMEFIATIDILMSDTAHMSDLVLPAHTYLERDDPCQVLPGGPAGPCAVWRKPVVPPLYDTRNPFDIFKGLAERMGLGEHFNFSLDEFRAAQLKSLGAETDRAGRELTEKGVYIPDTPIFGLYEGKASYKTSSKKIDLWSGLYEKRKQAPLPAYARPKQGEGFRLIVGRTALITQASSQNNAILAAYVPTNTLDINPGAAAALGIQDGDLVEVSSAVGKGRLRARLDPGIEAGCVYMHSGFGALSPRLSLQHNNGVCIAALMEDAMDAVSGNAAHHETFVRVKKV